MAFFTHPGKTAPGGLGSARRALPVELSALRHLVDRNLLYAAAARAERLGVGGDEVMIAHRVLDSDQIARALAKKLGLRFDPLDSRKPATSAVLPAAVTGLLRRRTASGGREFIVAPRGLKVRALDAAIRKNPTLRKSLRLSSPERMNAYVRRCGAAEIAHHAVTELLEQRPEFSAASRGKHGLRIPAILLTFSGAIAGWFSPHYALAVVEVFLGIAFLSWLGLRLYACRVRPAATPPLKLSDRSLPPYSVVVALYREAAVAPQLVDALSKLDYPPEKLDIKLVCEPDDLGTLEVLRALDLDPRFEIVIAPDAGPRTKPKALAAALPFARGDFLVIYDAEDIPDPDQLRKALAAYHRGPKNLACLQARLAVDNIGDSWLTRLFAAEYAGLFDAFLPALADLKLPLPLGGTSNHFRTSVLRQVGGWDPYNVTEDADLGMRLARFGFLSAVIDSSTFEEAPARLDQWLKQRTRWCKGWLQTWLVHMRMPGRLLRELGFGGFLAFQLLVGGTVLAALVHPFFLAMVISQAAAGDLLPAGETFDAARQGIAITTLGSGYLGSAALALVGMRRRRLMSTSWVLSLLPIYWILLSVAAWRGAIQLLIAPHLWEKTDHGMARTSRYGKLPPRPKFRAADANRLLPRPRLVPN